MFEVVFTVEEDGKVVNNVDDVIDNVCVELGGESVWLPEIRESVVDVWNCLVFLKSN